MGCCCNDTHSLIWIYRQLYFIICIYIRGIKSSGMLGMVSVETNPSVYIDFSWQLYFNVCIYKGYKVKWIADDGVLWKYPICLYRTWLTTLLYCLYIYKRYKVKWCKGDGLVRWQVFSSFDGKNCFDMRWWGGYKPPHLFFFSIVPVFVIGCSTMAHPASCLMGSPVRRGQLRDILWRVPASCPACHFPEIWYWGSIWWCRDQNRCVWSLSVG